MKVFYVSKFDWLGTGPMSTVSTMFTHAISRQNIKTVYITQSEKCEQSAATTANDLLNKRYGIVPDSNYSIHLFRKFTLIRSSTLFYLRALKYILLNARPGDIIYTRNSTFLPYLYVAKILKKSKIYFEAHGYHGSQNTSKKKYSNRYNLTENLFMGRIDGICSLTNAMSRLFEKDFPKLPILTLPLGARPVSEQLRIDTSKGFAARRLCYIGRCTDNIDTLTIFKAISICKSKDIKFLWIGVTAQQKNKLNQIADEFQITNQIELIEWLSYREMCETVHAKASAGIVAYTDSYESNVQISPTKLFDFFSFGMPVLGSKVGAVEEITGKDLDSFLYQPGNASDLASKITALFDSFQTYCRCCKISSDMGQIYTWENRAKRFLDFASTKSGII
ncbi:MAG: glycosyltransferase family 4 protein [Fibrobacter sp.]|nr:glycosyltransferase family 4 protein [Fibrobacter sp.]